MKVTAVFAFLFAGFVAASPMAVPEAEPEPLPLPDNVLERRVDNAKATYYLPANGSGDATPACGPPKLQRDGNYVALAAPHWQNGANCGRTIHVKNNKNGHTTTALVRDYCKKDCVANQIDLNPTDFKKLSDGTVTVGVLNVDWNFV